MQVPRRVISTTFKFSVRTILISLYHGKLWLTTFTPAATLLSMAFHWCMSTDPCSLPRCTFASVKQLTMAAPSHILAPLKPFTSIIIIANITVESLSCGFRLECTTTLTTVTRTLLRKVCMWNLVSVHDCYKLWNTTVVLCVYVHACLCVVFVLCVLCVLCVCVHACVCI